MKALCKRTYFSNHTYHKNTFYDYEIYETDYSLDDKPLIYKSYFFKNHSLNESEFQKYFIPIEEIRENKLKQILK